MGCERAEAFLLFRDRLFLICTLHHLAVLKSMVMIDILLLHIGDGLKRTLTTRGTLLRLSASILLVSTGK